MSDEAIPVKRGRGRPRVHLGETTVVAFRVSKKLAVQISSLLATIKLIEGRCGDADSDLLVEALEQRIRGLANQQPQIVEHVLRSLHRP